MKARGKAAVALALGLAYLRFVRAPIPTWESTDKEATGRLPGDELLKDADGIARRAITIDASTDAVWPWIAQMGPSPRRGAYTHDRIRLGTLATEPASLLMERKVLQVIKQCAERIARANG